MSKLVLELFAERHQEDFNQFVIEQAQKDQSMLEKYAESRWDEYQEFDNAFTATLGEDNE